MSQVKATYWEPENHYGSDLLNLVVANTFSKEETVLQQQGEALLSAEW